MAYTKEKDFVEIDYVGKIKESSQIFDLTDKDLAKKENIYNEHSKYGPKVICLGEKQIIPKLDSFLIGKDIGKSYTLELKSEEAFGKKDSSLIKIIPSSVLTKQRIQPFPGLQINASGLFGTVRSVAGGRVTVDFNHPLAGKNLVYELKLNKIVTNDDEKLKALVENMLDLTSEDYEVKKENNKVTIKLKHKLPSKAKEDFKKKTKELIPSLEVIIE